jgi:spore germination protein GerM
LTGHRRPRLAAAAVAVAAVALSACGIPTTGGPKPVSKPDVPFHLLAPQAPTTTTTTIPPTAFSVPVTVYFVAPSRQSLVATARSVEPPETLGAVLGVLLDGPTAIESDRNISTGFTAGVKVLDTTVTGSTATVDFNRAFGQISGTPQVLAVAQVVFTVAAQLGTDAGVQFEIAGKPTPVPTSSGAQATGPVHLLQYAGLAPAPTAGTASTGVPAP